MWTWGQILRHIWRTLLGMFGVRNIPAPKVLAITYLTTVRFHFTFSRRKKEVLMRKKYYAVQITKPSVDVVRYVLEQSVDGNKTTTDFSAATDNDVTIVQIGVPVDAQVVTLRFQAFDRVGNPGVISESFILDVTPPGEVTGIEAAYVGEDPE